MDPSNLHIMISNILCMFYIFLFGKDEKMKDFQRQTFGETGVGGRIDAVRLNP